MNFCQICPLTASADSGSSFTGSSGNDTFNGMVVADNGTGTTLTAGDNLVGGTGTDTLSVTVSGLSTGAVTVAATTLSGIETVLVSNYDSNTTTTEDHEFNASSWTGVTTLGLSASSGTANYGDTSFTNVAAIAAAVMKNGAADLTISYAAAAVAGAADTQTLALDGITAGTFVADAGIETVAITAASTATKSTLAALTSAGASKLTIDSDVALTITGALGTTVKTVDGSLSAGALSLVVSGVADYTVTGGTGNDTINIGAELTTADSLDGGAGTDTLVVTAAADIVTGLKVSNFETLRLTEAASADASFISGITTIDYRIAAAGSGGASNVTEGTAVTVSGDANVLTHSIKNATNSGVTNALTVTIDNSTADTDTEIAALAAAGVETLNIVSSGLASPSTYATTSENSLATVANTTSLTTLNITGAADFGLTTGANSTLATIDGSAATGRLHVTATAASIATTLTTNGGTAADTLVGRSGKDSIVGNAGNDTIDGADGNDTISGGDGNDSITGGTGNDSITGGAGNDTIDSEDGVDNVDGGDGDDTFNISTVANLDTDSLTGGLGNDTLRFTENANVDIVTDIAKYANVTGFEKIALGGAGGNTLTINDLALNILGGGTSLTVVADAAQSYTVNASGVLGATVTISLEMGDAITSSETTTYSVGNAKDNLAFGAGIGAVTVATAGFLSANDTVAGGATVSDAINFTADTATTIDTTATTHILANVTGVESITINTTDGTATADYVITLGDTFVAANYDATNSKFTISRAAADQGDTDVNGSAVTTYNLALTGGTAADTLTGGGGADTIYGGIGVDTIDGGAGADSIQGGTLADSLTGGAGNDIFAYTNGDAAAGANVFDTIADFSFGTSSTYADRFDLLSGDEAGGGAAFVWNAAFDTVARASVGATAADVDVYVMDLATYADDDAVETAVSAIANANGTAGDDAIVIWQDTLGNVHVSLDIDKHADDANANTTYFNLATLSGVTVVGIASLVDITDFIVT